MVRELGLGDTERQLRELALTLDRSRFQPHVGCFCPDGLRGEELRAAQIPIVRFPVRSFYAPSTICAAREMGEYLRRYHIQLVHTFDVPFNLFGVPTARAYRAYRTPVVISSQRAFRTLSPPMTRPLLQFTDRLADAVVVNCQALRQHLVEDERVPPELVHVYYNGIHTSCFRPLHARRVPAFATGPS